MLIGAMLAGQAISTTAEPPISHEIVFARGFQDGWALAARTNVNQGPRLPTIRSITCEIERNGLTVYTGRDGGIFIRISGETLLEEDPFDFSNIRWIVLDDVRYEARWGDRDHPRHFTDVDYPPPPSQGDVVSEHSSNSPKSAPRKRTVRTVTVVRSGFLAVRRGPGDYWQDVEALGNELLQSRRMRIGFREDDETELAWFEVPLDGLRPALDWCQRVMASERALRLHPD